jgi:cytochrome c-type biogenesis protein CcsB
VLIITYGLSLARHHIKPISFRNPIYVIGMLLFVGALVYHLYGYVLRWVASGRAPLSNGYESLIFIALMIGVAGLFYEMRSRRASVAALSGLLTAVILGVAMLPTFDAAISPLVPVLASYWLIIHVTIITASYGYLGLASVIAMAMLILYLFKRPGRLTLRLAILELNKLNWNVMVTGLVFLSVGTFLGGVWANESWGRYWGWDPKETWALVTILVYAFVAHFRFVDALNRPIHLATGSFLAIASVGMTYFGVNYFLSGLHSYAAGDAPGVPAWVYIFAAAMLALVTAAHTMDSAQKWDTGVVIDKSHAK